MFGGTIVMLAGVESYKQIQIRCTIIVSKIDTIILYHQKDCQFVLSISICEVKYSISLYVLSPNTRYQLISKNNANFLRYFYQ